MTTHLFLFQIGPVQAFIAQARRTQDLYVGSYTLSELARAGIAEATGQPGFEPIFPVVDERGQTQGSVPHRFAFICTGDPQTVAAGVEAAVRTEWEQKFADPVFRFIEEKLDGGAWQATFERQKSSWMEFYWAAVPYTGSHSEAYKKVSAALAQRKYARTFHQVDEPGAKCTLTGAQSALELDWNRLRRALYDDQGIKLRDNERLGALALIKRLVVDARRREGIPIEDFESFPSTDEIAAGKKGGQPDRRSADSASGRGKEVAGYLAVLHMDGDKMGKHISELDTIEEHQEFSRTLAEFAEKHVPEIVKEHGGETGTLVYAGGDDVLALLPLSRALRCADELRRRFNKLTCLTASAGIAITPANLPLDRALELARAAEEKAKEKYGRDALVITEAHGTGQIREAGGKWSVLDLILALQNLFAADALSGKLGYDLRMLDHDLFGDLRAAREAEIKRIVRRRTSERAAKEQRDEIDKQRDQMIDLVEAKNIVPTWSDMANWVILARFLAQGGTPERKQKTEEAAQ